MISKKILIIAAAAVAVGLGVKGFLAFQHRDNQAAVSLTDRLIADLSGRIQNNPDDTAAHILLADAYLQKIRETSDTSLYARIEELMMAAEKKNPENPDIPAIRAAVAAGRHDFAKALEYSQQAVGLRPQTARYYAILADAYIELGKYPEAVKALQTMVNLRPDFSSYSRIAHARELHGDIAGAIEMMEASIKAGSAFPENSAWAHVELGKLYMRTDLAKAEEYFQKALVVLPEYPRALQGLGRVAFFKGETKKAEDYFKKAFELLPITEHAIDLADFYQQTGNTAKAQKLTEITRVGFQKIQDLGTNVDLEAAFFLADHDLDLPRALEQARAAYAARPSMQGADTLAWALYKNQRYAEADAMIRKALALGTKDAAFYYHAGLIAQALGDTARATAMLAKASEYNPHFSILHAGTF